MTTPMTGTRMWSVLKTRRMSTMIMTTRRVPSTMRGENNDGEV